VLSAHLLHATVHSDPPQPIPSAYTYTYISLHASQSKHNHNREGRAKGLKDPKGMAKDGRELQQLQFSCLKVTLIDV